MRGWVEVCNCRPPVCSPAGSLLLLITRHRSPLLVTARHSPPSLVTARLYSPTSSPLLISARVCSQSLVNVLHRTSLLSCLLAAARRHSPTPATAHQHSPPHLTTSTPFSFTSFHRIVQIKGSLKELMKDPPPRSYLPRISGFFFAFSFASSFSLCNISPWRRASWVL